MENWLQILSWTPKHLNELRFLGFDLLKEGQYERAKIYFEALVLLDPHSNYDKQTLGAIYLELDENQKALDLFNATLTEDPSESILLNKTKALLGLGRKSEALTLAQTLAKSADPIISNDAQALILSYK